MATDTWAPERYMRAPVAPGWARKCAKRVSEGGARFAVTVDRRRQKKSRFHANDSNHRNQLKEQ